MRGAPRSSWAGLAHPKDIAINSFKTIYQASLPPYLQRSEKTATPFEEEMAALTPSSHTPTAETTGKADGSAVCQMVKLKCAVSISARPSASFSPHYLPNYSQPAVHRVAFDQGGEREGFCKVTRSLYLIMVIWRW